MPRAVLASKGDNVKCSEISDIYMHWSILVVVDGL